MTEKDWLKLLNLPKPYSGECQRLRVGWRNSKKKKQDAAAGLASRPHNLPQTHKSSQVSADFSPPQRPRHTNDATARRASRLAVTAKAATVTQRWRAGSETDADLAAAAQPSKETPVRCQVGQTSAVQRSRRETTCTGQEKQTATYQLFVFWRIHSHV